MAFTVEEFRDLVRLLEERPEWRAELRRLVLTDELLALPELVRALVEAQRRTEVQVAALTEAQRRTEVQVAGLAEAQRRSEERLDRLDERMAALAEAQRRTEVQVAALTEAQRRTEVQVAALAEVQRRSGERLDRLDERMAALAEAQRRTEVEMAALAEAQRRSEGRLDRLDERMAAMSVDLGELKGDSLERRYRERGPAYVAQLLRRPRVLAVEQVLALLEPAVQRGELPADEAEDVALADVVIRGRRRDDEVDVYLVLEVSWRVDTHDVERAVRRAAGLQRAGLAAMPAVAGRAILPAAAERARELGVWQLTDGQIVRPEP
ncbi:MAG TPA: hypothetical protein VNP04_19105 [Alphaproteobacteria bacterium]|nr:hypothetical protein [Alphaproteobacteria bacterium]